MPIDASSPVPAAISDLLAIFTTDLADVRFADVDRAALETDAARVRELGEALARAEAAVEAARDELVAAREHLTGRGQRALAYARIYAEGKGDTELAARLDEIPLPTAGRPEAKAAAQGDLVPRRRGRPPKQPSASAPLPLVPHEPLPPAREGATLGS